MPATMTIRSIETQVRQNHLFDTTDDAYRWSPQIVIGFVYDAIKELTHNLNPWSRFDQDTGVRLTELNVPEAKELGLRHASEVTDIEINEVRDLTIPVDNRFEQAIIHFVAAKCFSIDDSDVSNARKAGVLFGLAERHAQT